MALKIENLILEIHYFLANTHGNKGGKYYIKEMEKNILGRADFMRLISQDTLIGMRVRVAEFYPILRKRRYKNLLKGIFFLVNSKLGQCLLP